VQVIKLASPADVASFIYFCDQLQAERRENLADTFEARLIQAIEALEGEIKGGLLESGKITEHVNKGKSEKFHRSPTKVTQTLKSMGFKLKRPAGTTNIEIDPGLLERMRVRYGVHTPGKSAQSALTARDEENQRVSACTSEASEGADSQSAREMHEKVHVATIGNDNGSAECAERADSQMVYTGNDVRMNFEEGDFEEGAL
jgi:hypothetical protein